MTKIVPLIEASSSGYEKKYKCPYCELRLTRQKLPPHIDNKHADMIPEGYTALRVAFNAINHKDHGECIICKREAPWNEEKGRYERLCGRQECIDAYKEMARKRNKNVYGTEIPQSDPRYKEEIQKKALAHRKISGKYRFGDGGYVEYTGSYERKLLEYMDKIMHINSYDIAAPGPSIFYMYEGEEHLYISDFLYIPYNLIIEVKDGGSNKNNNQEMKSSREKTIAKEEAVKKDGKYNYLRLTDNDFSQLMEAFAVLKWKLLDEDTDEKYFKVNEFGLIAESILIEASYKGKLYHLSNDNLDGKTLHPRIPDNYMTKNGYEDAKTPRTSFSTFIDGCLRGMSYNCTGKEFYVNIPTGNYTVVSPTIKQVPDVKITKEKWITTPVKVKCIGKIKVTGDRGEPGMKYKYGNNEAELYDWDWEWVEKYDDKSVNESYIKNEEDIYYNKDKFDSGEINLCFITGHSGSGKSTMGRNMQNDNIEHYEMDDLQCIKDRFTMENLKEYGDLIYSYFNGPGKKFYITWNELKEKEVPRSEYEDKLFPGFVHYAMSYAKSHKDKKYVIEGIWFLCADENNKPWFTPNEFDNYAFYIKGTSAMISKYRATKRDAKEDAGNNKKKYLSLFVKYMTKNIKRYVFEEKRIKVFRDYFKNKMKSINEHTLLEIASDIDKDHKQKGKISLSKFKRVVISLDSIKEFKSSAKFLSHFRTGKDYTGYIWIDKDKVVAACNVHISENEIQAIEITKDYQGYGLSYQILDVCTKDLNGYKLTVNKSNQVAISLYKKYGFVIYKETDAMYFMVLKSKKNMVNTKKEMTESMNATIAAALAPERAPVESDPNNYMMVQHLQNNKMSYGITKDQQCNEFISVSIKDGMQVHKMDKSKIDKVYTVFKMKDKRKAKEVYDEAVNMLRMGTKVDSTDYFYKRYTGHYILTHDQICFDESFELITPFYDNINSLAESVEEFIKTDDRLYFAEQTMKEIERITYGK